MSLNLDEILISQDFDCESIIDLVEKNDLSVGTNSQSLVFMSIEKENYQLLEYLIEKGININIKNKYDETPLYKSVEIGNNRIINLLLENGADPNIQQKEGETPLHVACIKGSHKLVKLLLAYFADPFLKTFKSKYNALDYAKQYNQNKCIEILNQIVVENYLSKNFSENQDRNIENNQNGYSTSKNSAKPNCKFEDKQFKSNRGYKLPNFSSKNRSRRYSLFLNDGMVESSEMGSTNFISQMNDLEERLDKIKDNLNLTHTKDNNHTNDTNKVKRNIDYDQNTSHCSRNDKSHLRSKSQLEEIELNELWTKFGRDSFDQNEVLLVKNKSIPVINTKFDCLVNIDKNTIFTLRKQEIEEKKIDNNPEQLIKNGETQENFSRVTYSQECDNSLHKSKVDLKYKNKFQEDSHFFDHFKKFSESFHDSKKDVAVFISCKNDITYDSGDQEINREKAQDFNDSINFNEHWNNNEKSGKHCRNSFSNSLTNSQKFVKYFSKNKKDFKQISLDTAALDESNNLKKSHIIERDIKTKDNQERTIETELNQECSNEIHNFLKEIDLEIYQRNFIKNGFDDLQLIRDQMNGNFPITDNLLKEIGIDIPGYRARILIKLQEDSGFFDFILPLNIFYHLNSENDDWENDYNVREMKSWLSKLKLEKYLKNFIDNGYHSLDLLLFQMVTNFPITVQLLVNDFKITKIGYHNRLFSKLEIDSKAYRDKLIKNKIRINTQKNDESVCLRKCIIV